MLDVSSSNPPHEVSESGLFIKYVIPAILPVACLITLIYILIKDAFLPKRKRTNDIIENLSLPTTLKNPDDSKIIVDTRLLETTHYTPNKNAMLVPIVLKKSFRIRGSAPKQQYSTHQLSEDAKMLSDVKERTYKNEYTDKIISVTLELQRHYTTFVEEYNTTKDLKKLQNICRVLKNNFSTLQEFYKQYLDSYTTDMSRMTYFRKISLTRNPSQLLTSAYKNLHNMLPFITSYKNKKCTLTSNLDSLYKILKILHDYNDVEMCQGGEFVGLKYLSITPFFLEEFSQFLSDLTVCMSYIAHNYEKIKSSSHDQNLYHAEYCMKIISTILFSCYNTLDKCYADDEIHKPLLQQITMMYEVSNTIHGIYAEEPITLINIGQLERERNTLVEQFVSLKHAIIL